MNNWLKISVFMLLLSGIAGGALFPGLLSAAEINNFLLSLGLFAPLFFVILYAARGIFLFLPAGLLSVAGGMLFGTVAGTVLIMIGATFSALITFFLSAKLGSNLPQHFSGLSPERINTWRQKMQPRGFRYVLLLRLIPLFHFDLISIAAGLAQIPPRRFLWGTILGMFPFTVVNASLGNALVNSSQAIVITSISAILLLSVFPFFFPGFGKTIAKHL